MTQLDYQMLCMAALQTVGWNTHKTDRKGVRNEAGWLAYYDEDFRKRGTFCLPVALLRDPSCTLVAAGDSTGFFLLAKSHLRRELAEKRASLSDSREFLVVPVAIAKELAIISRALEVKADDDAEAHD